MDVEVVRVGVDGDEDEMEEEEEEELGEILVLVLVVLVLVVVVEEEEVVVEGEGEGGSEGTTIPAEADANDGGTRGTNEEWNADSARMAEPIRNVSPFSAAISTNSISAEIFGFR